MQKVLLVKRKIHTLRGATHAIPGGFVLDDEDLDQAALRELKEETGVADVYLEQLYSFGDPRRDPRGRIVSVSYFALISADRKLQAGTDASESELVAYKGAAVTRFRSLGNPELCAGAAAQQAELHDGRISAAPRKVHAHRVANGL